MRKSITQTGFTVSLIPLLYTQYGILEAKNCRSSGSESDMKAKKALRKKKPRATPRKQRTKATSAKKKDKHGTTNANEAEEEDLIDTALLEQKMELRRKYEAMLAGATVKQTMHASSTNVDAASQQQENADYGEEQVVDEMEIQEFMIQEARRRSSQFASDAISQGTSEGIVQMSRTGMVDRADSLNCVTTAEEKS